MLVVVGSARLWWVEQGANQTPQSGKSPEQRLGGIFVSVLSQTQVYCRGSNPLGGPNVERFSVGGLIMLVLTGNVREQICAPQFNVVLTVRSA